MKTTHLFAGTNSVQGFYSHFSYLVANSFKRVYILKGGPGTGKSTIIRNIARAYHGPLEAYHCTSAAKSLDGLVIPALNLSIVDGTTPHVLEGNLPGAVHQTIELSAYWDSRPLTAARNKIEALNLESKRRVKSAYRWLKIAGALTELGEEPVQKRKNPSFKKELEMIDCLLPRHSPLPNWKKAFATAITGQGPVSFLSRLTAKSTVALTGGGNHLSRQIIRSVARRLKQRKLPAILLYCGFQPQHLEHLYIPGEFALISSHPPHLASTADYTIDCEIEHSRQPQLQSQVDHFIGQGIEALAAAAQLHEELESIYTPHMDFQRVELVEKQIRAEMNYLS